MIGGITHLSVVNNYDRGEIRGLSISLRLAISIPMCSARVMVPLAKGPMGGGRRLGDPGRPGGRAPRRTQLQAWERAPREGGGGSPGEKRPRDQQVERCGQRWRLGKINQAKNQSNPALWFSIHGLGHTPGGVNKMILWDPVQSDVQRYTTY